MIDYCGRWHWVPDMPREDFCDLDYLMECIEKHGGYTPDYVPMETFLLDIIEQYYAELNSGEEYKKYFAIPDPNPDSKYMINADDVWEFIQASGGLQEFDYLV